MVIGLDSLSRVERRRNEDFFEIYLQLSSNVKECF